MRQEVDSLEKMTDFFSARVDIYDDHMMNEIEGCQEGYLQMAELVPQTTETISGMESMIRQFPLRRFTILPRKRSGGCMKRYGAP